ncbi:hypothetical protein MAR_016378 [Mya arenaria]|uniref:NACHT domain-containing protein n=1 Tax=Mya arenaria TaxID=6604 RepID=A0ABY7FMM1_MYAAR|nr:uncharacterized protein LOC128210258 [Mya arenaria]WAR22404.1 hypothetical protein MAR_016378 [Mya arenaria]
MADSCDVQRVNDPLHRNWLKAVRALLVLKYGVEDFVDTHTKKYHEQLKSDARKLIFSGNLEKCSQCLVKQILPWHVHTKSSCPYRDCRHLKCLCVQNMRGKLLCSSPGSPCSVIFDLIVAGHSSRNPIFNCTDCSQWASDYWSICLCYLSTQRYSKSTCASDLDAAGLLSVMINCKFLHNYIDDITPLQRVRKSRNEILHSATYQLSEIGMRDIIQDIICILTDKQHLLKDPKAQLATQQLIEIMNDEDITLDEAKELEQIAINSIEMTKEIAIETLTEHTDIQLQKIQKKHDEFFEKTKVDTTVSQEVLDDLQQYLIDTYRQYYVKVDVTPLLPEEDDDIEHLYVPLRMEKVVKTYQSNLGHDLHQKVNRNEETVQQIDTFEEMLTSDGDCKKNICVIADAGMGKTTLCRKITSSWCFSHENPLSKQWTVKENSTQTGISNKTESKFVRQASTKNMLYMQRFRFLFYVSLRHAAEERSIEEMIVAQLLEHSHNETFRWIIKTMPEQCLYIVDGLDEWRMQTKNLMSPKTPSGIPKKESRCTAIFTSRPWKMTEILPRPSDIDIEIRLKGMSTESIKILSGNVLDKLNKYKGKSLKVDDFQHEIEQRKLQSLLAVPLMLKLLLCSWFNNHKLHETKTEIYVDVVQLMLKIFRDQKEHRCVTRTISEPSDNDLDMLPPVLRQKEEYIQFARMMVGLAEFSFTSFIQSDSLVFESSKLTHCGMKHLDVES